MSLRGVWVLSHLGARWEWDREDPVPGAAPAVLTRLRNCHVALISRHSAHNTSTGHLGKSLSLSPYTVQPPEEYFTSEVPWLQVSAKPLGSVPARELGFARTCQAALLFSHTKQLRSSIVLPSLVLLSFWFWSVIFYSFCFWPSDSPQSAACPQTRLEE